MSVRVCLLQHMAYLKTPQRGLLSQRSQAGLLIRSLRQMGRRPGRLHKAWKWGGPVCSDLKQTSGVAVLLRSAWVAVRCRSAEGLSRFLDGPITPVPFEINVQAVV